jgi:hypothetical protein
MNKIVSSCVSTLVPCKNFASLYSRVGARAASKFLPGAGAAKKMMRLHNTGSVVEVAPCV